MVYRFAAHHWPIFSYTPKPMNLISSVPLPIPHPSQFIASTTETAAREAPCNRFSPSDPDAGRKAYHAKRAEWAKLSLRQTWADADFMRAHLHAAGLQSPDKNEPATVTRLRCLLRRAGVDAPETMTSVGTSLAGFLTLNPSLPLWAAVALVLESTGRFTQIARKR